MKYGYARVALLEGNNLEYQISILKSAGCSEVVQSVGSGLEIHSQLIDLLERMEQGDCLVITDLGRISRDVGKSFEILDYMETKGLLLIVLNEQ